MKLAVFNGSPRGKESNTHLLLEKLLAGYSSQKEVDYEIDDLVHLKKHAAYAEKFVNADLVFFGFPLYTDSMPGIVKAFIEELSAYIGQEKMPAVVFLVQSGFPEATHSRRVERYLAKLAKRLGCQYLGTIVKGGIEGIRIQPESMTKKLFEALTELGQVLAQSGTLDEDLLQKFAKPEHLSRSRLLIYQVLGRLGIANFYWDMQLKQNKAFKDRFARPYENQLP